MRITKNEIALHDLWFSHVGSCYSTDEREENEAREKTSASKGPLEDMCTVWRRRNPGRD